MDQMDRNWDQLQGIDWSLEAKNLLRAELKRRGVTYAMLQGDLSNMGIEETVANLRNKISRGAFTTAFFLQCLAAIGADRLSLGKLYELTIKF